MNKSTLFSLVISLVFGVSCTKNFSAEPLSHKEKMIAAIKDNNSKLIEEIYSETLSQYSKQFTKDKFDSIFLNSLVEEGYGTTYLMYAIELGHLDAAKTLIDLGASLDKTNFYACDALDIAIVNNRFEIVRSLLDSGAKISTALDAIDDKTNPDIVNLLVLRGAPISATLSRTPKKMVEKIRLLQHHLNIKKSALEQELFKYFPPVLTNIIEEYIEL